MCVRCTPERATSRHVHTHTKESAGRCGREGDGCSGHGGGERKDQSASAARYMCTRAVRTRQLQSAVPSVHCGASAVNTILRAYMIGVRKTFGVYVHVCVCGYDYLQCVHHISHTRTFKVENRSLRVGELAQTASRTALYPTHTHV